MICHIRSVFSKKELFYIKELIKRNSKDVNVEATERLTLWIRGLEKPMSPAERKMRERIRKKAIVVALNLVGVYLAGILPFKGLPETAGDFIEKLETDEMANAICAIQQEGQSQVPKNVSSREP